MLPPNVVMNLPVDLRLFTMVLTLCCSPMQPQLDAIKLFNQLAAADDLRMDAVLEPGGTVVSATPGASVACW